MHYFYLTALFWGIKKHPSEEECYLSEELDLSLEAIFRSDTKAVIVIVADFTKAYTAF